jgi:hypothetical protein
MPAATYLVTGYPDEGKHGTHNDRDDAQRPDDRNRKQESDEKQNYPENDHG